MDAMGSVGGVEWMLEWSCSMSIKDTAWSTGERIIVVLRDVANYSWVETGQKLWGLMVA